MIRQYFKLSKAGSDVMLADYNAHTEPMVQTRADLVAKFKDEFHTSGRTVYKVGHLNERFVVGYEVGGGDRIPKWANRTSFNEVKNECYYWEPKRNFKRGKEFDQWLKKINSIRIPSFSSFVVEKAIDSDHSMIYGHAMHYAVAGCNNDTVVLSVPTTDEKPVSMTGNWDFKSIKKSEYIAITEE